jgi:hydrogenase 3 maturation protease
MVRLDLPTPRPARVAIIGVGNELNGDDAAGVRVVRDLARQLPATPGVLLIDGGAAPENFTGPIRRFRPDLVIEVDAAAQDQPPGAVALVDWRDADGFSASTHTLPPTVLATFLTRELGCGVALVGIQPQHLDFGVPMSPAVVEAVRSVVECLRAWLAS